MTNRLCAPPRTAVGGCQQWANPPSPLQGEDWAVFRVFRGYSGTVTYGIQGQSPIIKDYEYDARDLPVAITEYGPGPQGSPAQALTTFTYDRRARLTRETRVYYPNPNDPTQNYDLEYQYDKGRGGTV